MQTAQTVPVAQYPTSRYIKDLQISKLDDTLAHDVVKTMMQQCTYNYIRRAANIRQTNFESIKQFGGVRTISISGNRKCRNRSSGHRQIGINLLTQFTNQA